MNNINKKVEYVNINNDYIVVKKPIGMSVYGDGEEVLNNLVDKEYPLYKNDKNKFGVIYNLEKEIEGLVLFSRNENFHNQILENIQKNFFKIKYLAIIFSEKNNKFFKRKDLISLSLNKKDQIKIFYEIINSYNIYNTLSIDANKHSEYQVNILLNSINTSIIGDIKYGGIKFHTFCLFLSEICFNYNGVEINISLNNFYTHKVNNLLMHLHF
jgi:23S rRNA-/tRNA-specific pseudouridylate synthase